MKKIKNYNSFTNRIDESVEDDKRLNDKVLEILNKQIKNELESSQIYRAISCWLDNAKWMNASKYYFKSAQEELTHMDKIYEYIFERNCLAEVPTVDKVKTNYSDIKQILEVSLEHEITVSENWEEIAELAKKVGDNTTYNFSQWFLNEQKEEETRFRDLLFKLSLETPKWKMDENFADLLK
jgi:ferritin